jgi:hypothetical protein
MLLVVAATIEAVSRNPFVAGLALLAITTWGAYRFGEKWQRWRQQRDFQYQAMLAFARNSAEALGILYRLTEPGADVAQDQQEALRRDYAAKLALLLATDAEFFAAVGEDLVPDLDYLARLMNAAFLLSRRPGSSAEDVGKVRKCATAQRRLTVMKISREMKLGTGTEELFHRLEREAKALPHGVTLGEPAS